MKTNNRIIELFLELAKINSTSGEERAIVNYIKTFLQKLNLTPVEDESYKSFGGNAGNIVCKIGTGGDFILLSHLDTARTTQGMKHIISEDRITSDGNTVLGVDDRAGIAAILFALEKVKKGNIKHKDFTIGFTVCEETTLNGSKNILLDPNLRMGFVFDSSYRPGYFINSTPGAMGFNIEIIGKASHSGIAPEKGINSISIASKAISKLEWGRLDEKTTANIGVIQGGSAVNVVPEITKLTGEVRSFDNQRIEEIIGIIHSTFKNYCDELGAKLEFSSVWDFKPYKVDTNSPAYKKIRKALIDSNLEPKPTISFGGSDANSLNERGLATINIGIGAQNPHSNDEFIYLEDLEKSAEIAFNLIKE